MKSDDEDALSIANTIYIILAKKLKKEKKQNIQR